MVIERQVAQIMVCVAHAAYFFVKGDSLVFGEVGGT